MATIVLGAVRMDWAEDVVDLCRRMYPLSRFYYHVLPSTKHRLDFLAIWTVDDEDVLARFLAESVEDVCLRQAFAAYRLRDLRKFFVYGSMIQLEEGGSPRSNLTRVVISMISNVRGLTLSAPWLTPIQRRGWILTVIANVRMIMLAGALESYLQATNSDPSDADNMLQKDLCGRGLIEYEKSGFLIPLELLSLRVRTLLNHWPLHARGDMVGST
jgi:hypothetical protein